MGVMSRRVLPACGSLCYCCPSLRARSRQPVKRYKKLLAEIFPRSQDGEPNDRMIGKLCEYASKNPTSIPKITEYLEQRCYKELRNEHFYLAKVVPHVYRKLLSSCKEQMPLFATSLLSIVQTLLDQRQVDIRVLGCLILVDFLNSQVDSTYMFNVEGLIPKLCQVGQEIGQDDRGLRLRSAGLQALASMVRFMGEYSHISMDFDDIVSVTLDNYEVHQMESDIGKQDFEYNQAQNHSREEVARIEDPGSSFQDSWKKILSVNGSIEVELDATVDVTKNPQYWSRVCLHNMVKLAKEATTVRRVLEPLFRNFDNANCWSPENGIACSVLREMQVQMEKSGENSHSLLSIIIKHLDHKNIGKQPIVQINIVNVAVHLARHVKAEPSLAIVTTISDLMRHLRKCMQCSIEESNMGDHVNKCNPLLHSAIEECLMQLIDKVGDVGPILDMMAVMLENIPSAAIIARTTMSSAYRTAQIASSVHKLPHHKKAFPEALFHQLLLAMAHPDNETRVGAHRVFSAILAPSLTSPWLVPFIPVTLKGYDPQGSLLVAISGFSSSRAILEVIQKSSVRNESLGKNEECAISDGRDVTVSGEEESRFMGLSGHQVGLLLSSIWAQATSQDSNIPANYEAMAHTYSLALLFTRAKNSSHTTLVRCFQLALSLRSISLDPGSTLQPSCRRSLYTLASSMLVFSAKAGDLLQLIPYIKAMITEKMIDPYLHLVNDRRLIESASDKVFYGSVEDDIAATKSLATIDSNDEQIKATVTSHLVEKLANLQEEKLIDIKEQLLQEFLPDDAFPLGAPLFKETLRPCSPLIQELQSFDEATASAMLEDEDPFPEAYGSHTDQKMSESMNSLDVLSVNQLIESVFETARQVASIPSSNSSVSYDQMKNQCEALVQGKQQKMSVLLSFKQQEEGPKGSPAEGDVESTHPPQTAHFPEADLRSLGKESMRRCDSLSSESEQSFRLPPSSPYDKFLKAAGW